MYRCHFLFGSSRISAWSAIVYLIHVWPSEHSDIFFVKIDQHLESYGKKTNGSRFYGTVCSVRLALMTDLTVSRRIICLHLSSCNLRLLVQTIPGFVWLRTRSLQLLICLFYSCYWWVQILLGLDKDDMDINEDKDALEADCTSCVDNRFDCALPYCLHLSSCNLWVLVQTIHNPGVCLAQYPQFTTTHLSITAHTGDCKYCWVWR